MEELFPTPTVVWSQPTALTAQRLTITSMRGGAIFGWIVFAFLIAGFGAYIVWWRKSKFGKPLIEPSKRKWWMVWRKQNLADSVSPHYNAAFQN